MNTFLKYAIVIVPVVAVIALASMFGRIGVRPRALPVIKPSTFSNYSEIGFWTSRSVRQKIFRNQLVFLGVENSNPSVKQASKEVIEGFLQTLQLEGPPFDVLVSSEPFNVKSLLPIFVPANIKAEALQKSIEPYLIGKKRVIVVLDTPQTSKLVKASFSRKFSFEFGRQLAAISVMSQNKSDMESLRESEFCDDAEKLSFDNPALLRCLFVPFEKKFDREISKTSRSIAAAVDQFGLDDYFIYLYKN